MINEMDINIFTGCSYKTCRGCSWRRIEKCSVIKQGNITEAEVPKFHLSDSVHFTISRRTQIHNPSLAKSVQAFARRTRTEVVVR